MPKLPLTHYVAFICFGCLLLLPQLVTAHEKETELPSIALLQPAPMPVLAKSSDPVAMVASLSARAALVIDIPSAAILVSKEAQAPLPPASTTKIITALVARDTYELETPLLMPDQINPGGTVTHLVVGKSYTVRSLLSALLVSSGNDAAALLAYYHPGGREGFVAAMNQKAKDLHLENTYFANPAGLDEDGHLTTARDLGVAARAMMSDVVLREVVGQHRLTITDTAGEVEHILLSTNELLGVEPGVVGIKTGTTLLAGEALITQVNRNNHQLLVVILGSERRYQDTRLLLQWVEQNYTWESVSNSL